MIESILAKISKPLALVLLLSLLVFNVFLFLSHQLNMSWIFNSDVTFVSAMYKDIIINGGSYSSWHLSAAPYLFPDMLLYFFAIFITGSYYYSVPLFLFMQSLLIVYGIYKVYGLFYKQSNSFQLATIAFAFIIIFPSIASQIIYISTFHLGEFVIGLFSVYLILKIIMSPVMNIYDAMLLVTLSAFTYASDNLYLLHLTLPASASIFTLAVFRKVKFKQALSLILLLIIGVVLGYILYKLVVLQHFKPKIFLQLSGFNAKLEKFYQLFQLSLNDYFVSTCLSIFVYLMAILIIAIDVFRKQSSVAVVFSCYFLIFVLLANMSSGLLLKDTVEYRYMLPLFISPIILLPVFITYFDWKKKNYYLYILPSLIIILFISLIVVKKENFTEMDIHSEYYPDIVKCFDDFVDETKVKYGVSGYWLSKKLYTLTKNNDVIIAQYISNFNKFLVVTSDEWYQSKYNFLMIDYSAPYAHKLDKTKTLKKIGKPDEIFKCQNMEIMYYKKGFVL